jgi:hypothetical protein
LPNLTQTNCNNISVGRAFAAKGRAGVLRGLFQIVAMIRRLLGRCSATWQKQPGNLCRSVATGEPAKSSTGRLQAEKLFSLTVPHHSHSRGHHCADGSSKAVAAVRGWLIRLRSAVLRMQVVLQSSQNLGALALCPQHLYPSNRATPAAQQVRNSRCLSVLPQAAQKDTL